MDGKSKFIAGLVLGAAAGAAVALFLQSEKGKEMMQKFDDEVSELLRKGKQFVEDLENKAKDAGTSA